MSSEAIGNATGCTVEQYAAMKRLPVEFLRSLQIVDRSYSGLSRLVIPYLDHEGNQIATRYRLALRKAGEVDDRFCWKKGAKLALYGLWRLPSVVMHNYGNL